MAFELRQTGNMVLLSLGGLALFCLLRGNPPAAGCMMLAAIAIRALLLVLERAGAARGVQDHPGGTAGT
jgi:hypothetical protein